MINIWIVVSNNLEFNNMGSHPLDQFTLLHLATGIIAYFWNIPLLLWTILHITFELIENTPIGIQCINQSWIKHIWPGAKPFPDHWSNSIGDTIAAIIGWLIAQSVDQIGAQYGLYPKHL